MPRPMRVPLSNTLVTVPKGEAAPAPAPGRRRPVVPAIERVPLTFRITTASYERLRRMAFETRVSQQALVDQALDRFFADRG
jgi:Ribbon-helix-helix domain